MNQYLRATDDAVYATADLSWATNGMLDLYAAVLAGWMPATAPADDIGKKVQLAGPWVPLGDGARVQLTGLWASRPTWSSDPNATITWEFPVPAPGNYTLWIRYPGDSQQQNTIAAQLSVVQGGKAQPFPSVNLQENTQQWLSPGSVPLSGGGPCQVILSQPTPPPTLIQHLPFVEARIDQVLT